MNQYRHAKLQEANIAKQEYGKREIAAFQAR